MAVQDRPQHRLPLGWVAASAAFLLALAALIWADELQRAIASDPATESAHEPIRPPLARTPPVPTAPPPAPPAPSPPIDDPLPWSRSSGEFWLRAGWFPTNHVIAGANQGYEPSISQAGQTLEKTGLRSQPPEVLK